MIEPINDFPEYCMNGSRCTFCGSGRPDGDDQVILGPDIEYEGSIAVCGNCVREMAQVFGLISPDKYEELESKVKGLEGHIASLTLEIVELNERSRTLTLQNAELISEIDFVFEEDEDEYEDEEL